MVVVCDSTLHEDAHSQHGKELEQLSRQGVTRFSGFAKCLKVLGAICIEKECEDTVVLGRTGHTYALTRDTTKLSL